MAGEKNGNETLAELLAAARSQLNDSGKDLGPLDKLTLKFEETLDVINKMNVSTNDKIKSLEQKLSDSIADQIVEGQRELRRDAVHRKGGFSTLENAEVYARLIDPAGLTLEQKLTMPDDQLRKYLSPDAVQRVKIFQDLNDDALMLGWIMGIKKSRNGGFNEEQMKQHLLGTRTWKALQAVHKALITTGGSATGAEWMPTQFSSQLVDVISISLKVAANFARINIPANTFKVPIATTDDIAFLVPEATSSDLLDEANEYPKFTPGTGNVTFNAKKLAAIVVFSEESEEDSIIPLLPFIRMKIGNSMANAQERATLDGDTTGTHMDNDVSVATDARKAWKGLRKGALTMATSVDLSTFTLATIRTLREGIDAQFAENPESLFYASSVKVMLKMLSFPEFLTVDKYGDRATIIKGEVGRLDGSPLQTSKYSRDNVASTGVNTSGGPNTKSLLYLQNRLGYWYGDRREVRIDSGKMIMSGLGFMVISQRMDFVAIYPVASNKHAALGKNI